MANTSEDRRAAYAKYAVAAVVLAASLYHIHYTPKTLSYSTDVIVLFGVIFYLLFAGIRRIRAIPVRALAVALIMGLVYYFRPMQWSTIALFALTALF